MGTPGTAGPGRAETAVAGGGLQGGTRAEEEGGEVVEVVEVDQGGEDEEETLMEAGGLQFGSGRGT